MVQEVHLKGTSSNRVTANKVAGLAVNKAVTVTLVVATNSKVHPEDTVNSNRVHQGVVNLEATHMLGKFCPD